MAISKVLSLLMLLGCVLGFAPVQNTPRVSVTLEASKETAAAMFFAAAILTTSAVLPPAPADAFMDFPSQVIAGRSGGRMGGRSSGSSFRRYVYYYIL
jgi:hypothetical protein